MSDQKDFSDKVAVVIGAGSGIGEACAVALSSAGATTVLGDLNLAAAEKATHRIEADGGKAVSVEVDVTDAGSVDDLRDEVVSRFGKVDIVVNCAGVSGPKDAVVDVTNEAFEAVIRVNLIGSLNVGRAFGRAMLDRSAGTMIFFSSDRGLFGKANGSPYAASKGAVIAFVKSLALELGPHGITANAVNPGPTNTPMLRGSYSNEKMRARLDRDPLGRLTEPEDIAELVMFLAGPGGRFMTGQLVTVHMGA
jgi:2-hydroxycyclohexanecarboxyl-CoA dehydrogenase